ncbi:MAG: CDP-archaeol synthase [Gammaproteobacteria bacterium]|nr:CDP-archaeol synthase [Gammaproteobacteria bacterium]
MRAQSDIQSNSRHHGMGDFFIIRLNVVDMVTLSGVVLSCISIALMLNGKRELSLAILYLAVIADAFDGVLARKLKLERDFGRYLDGFVDTLDYLVAPALFVFLWGFNAWYQGLLLVIFIMCGFIRLAVFNQVGNITNAEHRLSYWGAPVFWSTLALGPIFIAHWFIHKELVFYLLMLILPLFSIAMLHNGQYYKFKSPLVMLTGLLAFSMLFINTEFSAWQKHMLTAVLAIFPLVFAGVLHMLVVKHNFLQTLAIPINKTWFGASKTWRGVVVMPLFCAAGFYIMDRFFNVTIAHLSFDINRYSPVALGLMLGLAYIMAELPNSFIKRRMGIAAGALPGKHKLIFIMADQLDSVIGCGLVYVIVVGMPLVTFLYLTVIGVYIALAVKSILYYLGYKKTRA